jgi:hypothetical protein
LDSVDSGRLHTTTFPHDTGRFSAIGKSILIGKGDSPEGAYELAAYAAKTPPGQEHTVGGAKIATCIDLDFPSSGEAPNANKTCFGGKVESPLHLSGLSQLKGAGGAFVLTGETSPRAQIVVASYVRSDGRTIAASGSYGVITPRVAEAAGIHRRAGELVAFLPHKAVMPTGSEQGLELAPSLEVTVYDGDGYAMDRDHWGDR